MKRRLCKQGVFLLAISLLLCGAVPCQAMMMKPPKEVSSMGELLTWYRGLSGSTLQEGVVTAGAVCIGAVVLEETSCRVDIVFTKGLRIPSGAKLTIDNSNLVLMGPPSVIVVERGGTLQISRINPLTAVAMPQRGIVVEEGGTLLTQNGVTLPDGVVENQNAPPNTTPPMGKPELPEPEPPDKEPNESDKPSDGTEGAAPAEKLPLYGAILKVTEKGLLSARLTVPFVAPLSTEAVTIERSRDCKTWSTEYVFRWNEDGQDFRTDSGLCSHNRRDRSKTDFQYLAMLSGTSFYLRLTVTAVDGAKVVSNPIQMTELPVGQYPGSEDYEDSEGNRGGGGQGTSERETQQEAAASGEGGSLPTASQEKPGAFIETTMPTELERLPPLQAGADASAALAKELPLPSKPNTVLEFTGQAPSHGERDTSPLQVTEETPPSFMEEQATPAAEEAVSANEEAVPVAEEAASTAGQSYGEEEALAPNSASRGALAVVATLVLCGILWAVTGIKFFKRKKS